MSPSPHLQGMGGICLRAGSLSTHVADLTGLPRVWAKHTQTHSSLWFIFLLGVVFIFFSYFRHPFIHLPASTYSSFPRTSTLTAPYICFFAHIIIYKNIYGFHHIVYQSQITPYAVFLHLSFLNEVNNHSSNSFF